MKSHLALTILIPCLIFLSCQDNSLDFNHKIENGRTNSQKLIKPFLLDTFNFNPSIKYKNQPTTANYFPLYFGQEKDIIALDYRIIPYPLDIVGEEKNKNYPIPNHQFYKEYILGVPTDNSTRPDSGKIEIIIDTNQTICNIESKFYQDSIIAFQAYPVLLKNTSNEPKIMGRGQYLSIIMEAKDSLGKWKAIEKEYSHTCWTITPYIILPPNEILITSASIYDGNYKTLLRLKIGENYSNEFWRTINLTQIEEE
jgi:hypothetical protein